MKDKIFFLPSWYPNSPKDYSGVFSRSQIQAINKFSDDYECVLIYWGQGHEYFPLKRLTKLSQWSKFRFLFSRENFCIDHDGITRINCKPPILWSHQLPFGGHNRLIPKLIQSIETYLAKTGSKIALFHAHVSYPGGYLAKALSEYFTRPYIITEFMGPFPFPHFLVNKSRLKNLIKNPLANSNANIVLSKYLQDRFMYYNLPKPSIIPFSVDGELFRPMPLISPPVRRQNPTKDTVFTIIFVGSIVKEKGIGDLLRAISLLAHKNYCIKLEVVGSGIEINTFKKLSIQLGISKSVTWHGPIPNSSIPELMHKSDIFVMPSWLDTFGVVYIEALACGLPVIATLCGGPDSFILPCVGQLVPIQSPHLLAEAISKVMMNIKEYSSENIRRYFDQNFSEEAIVSQLVQLYGKLKTKN